MMMDMAVFVTLCVANTMVQYVHWFWKENQDKASKERLTYMSVNMFKASVLSVLAVVGTITPYMTRGSRTGQWPDLFVSLGVPVYVTLDIVGVALLAKHKMAMSTLLHHVCVIVGGIICLTAPRAASLANAHAVYLTSIMVYGYCSALLYIVNQLMATKYDARRAASTDTMRCIGKLYTSVLSVNFLFQAYYTYCLTLTGDHLFLALQLATVAGYVQDDLCLRRWLQKGALRIERVEHIVYCPASLRAFAPTNE